MAFELDSIVPWGRNFDEYRRMFGLNDSLRDKSIASFGDGPASFNFEATQQGWTVRSFDPVYAFFAEDLEKRIEEVRPVVMSQLRENQENYIWETFQSPDEVEKVRMSAMRLFLTDYEDGKREGRYVQHTLPDSVPEDAGTFDIGLSSHFLLMYTALGYDFHIAAIDEMLRLCREVRIFPIVDLDGVHTDLAAKVIEHYAEFCDADLQDTTYAFQKGDNKLLVLRPRDDVSRMAAV